MNRKIVGRMKQNKRNREKKEREKITMEKKNGQVTRNDI